MIFIEEKSWYTVILRHTYQEHQEIHWAREPQMLSLRVWSLCPATGGAATERGPRTAMKSGPRTAMKSGPRLPQLEKALARTEDPTQSKINK